jgi:hypothetical protein
MNNIYKLYDIKLICGKNRKIFIKTNKKNSKVLKTKYIRYKGEYIKLKTFTREYDKNNRKISTNHNKKNVIIINNINDIKDKKIRSLFNKTFKKNAKIYIYTDTKLSRGGGTFIEDVSRNNDIVAPRNFDAIPTPHISHSRFDDLIPYQLKIHYNNKYDDIITEILEIGKTKLFERINNLEYTIVVDGTTFVIRPFIDFAPYKKFFLYFYINTDKFNDNGIKKWIKLPLHLSLFLNDMIEKFDKTPSSKIKCLTTGHIHITSDDKIGANNISTLLDSTKINRKTSATLSTSTHTYLIAKNLEQAAHIIKTHREQIFKDWFYDTKNETETSSLKSSLFIPNNNKWGPISHSDGNNSIILSSIQKQQIYVCFNKLQYIISNILYILYKKTGSNINLNTFDSGVVMIDNYKQYFTERVKPEHYLTYTVPVYPANINIRYLEKDETKRKGVIYEKDLENANVNKGYCPGTNKHKANSHDMHSAHSPHLPQRSRSPPRARSHPLPPLPPLRSRSPPRGHPLPPLRSRSPPRARSHPLPPLPPLRSRSPPRGHPQQPIRSRSPPQRHHQPPLRSRSPLQRHHQQPIRSRSPPQRHHQPPLRSRSPPLPIRMGSRERDRY